MLDKPFDEINKADIDALVKDRIVECKTLEYKEILPGESDKDKIKFLADVTSFANASGGYLIYGLRDIQDKDGLNTGTPEAIGLEGINVDEQKLRLEQSMLNGIEPRIPGLQINDGIKGFPKGPVIIIKIPKSWASPHMVKLNNHSRFYSRTSSGKTQLDVQEIRAAFALSDTFQERIKKFRDGRLAKIIGDETPVILRGGARTVLHVVPMSSLDMRAQVDLAAIANNNRYLLPLGLIGGSFTRRYNFDGYLAFETSGDSCSIGYAQLFRSGAIEAVDTYQFNGEKKSIASEDFEEGLLKSLKSYFTLLSDQRIDPPVFIMLTMLGVKGYRMGVTKFHYPFADRKPLIEDDTLVTPEVLVEDYETDPADFMRSTFDTIWQAAGWPRSMNYNEEGKRVKQ